MKKSLVLLASALLGAASSVFAADATWSSTATSGTWSNSANWSGGTVADGAGSLADFSQVDISAARTITLDSSRTIGRLIFGDAVWNSTGYDTTLQSGTLTLDNTGGTGGPSITIANRNTTISTVLAGSNGLSLALPWSNYDATRGMTAPSSGMILVQTTGGLTFTGSNSLSGALNVSGGTVTLGGASGSFSSATGLTVTGNGVFVNGDATAANNNGVANRIGDGTATLTLGGATGAGTFTSAFAATGTTSQTFASLTANAGHNTLNTANTAAGTNNLIFTGAGGGGYVRGSNGIVNVVSATGFNPKFTNAPTAAGGSSVSGAGSDAILIGAVLNGSDFIAAASGTLSPASYVTTLTADKNVNVTGSLSTSGNISINSLRMGDTTQRTVTIGASDTLTIASGGIILPASTGTTTNANINHTITGGSLTSGTGDLWIYSVTGAYNNGYPRNNGDPRGSSLAATIASKITGNISVTVSGGLNGLGNTQAAAQVLLSGSNNYTGGTYLAGGAIRINADSGLGATSGTVTALSGVNSIGPNSTITFDAARNFVINSGALLQINNISTIPGQISGGGILEVGVVGGGSLLILTGSNSGFTGQYSVQGQLRGTDGVGLSSNANIFLDGRGGNGNGGIIESSGSFNRALGSGPGQIQWANDSYGEGGFAAVGGPLTVNLGGSATPSTLTWGSGGFIPFAGNYLDLGNSNSTNDVTFQNGIALNGAARNIYVTANGTTKAIISGVLSGNASSGINKQGTGTLVLSGSSTYQGKTTIPNGTVSVASLNSVSGGATSSNLGAPTTVANGTIDLGANGGGGSQNAGLTYTGTGETTDRVLNMLATNGQITLTQSGTGLLKFTSNLTSSGGRRTTEAAALILDGSTSGNGEISGAISDSTYNVTVAAAAIGSGTLSVTSSPDGNLGFTRGNIKVSGSGIAPGSYWTGYAGTTGTLSAVTTSAISAGQQVTLIGTYSLLKQGTGTWTLSGTNSYTGITTLNGGILSVNNLANGGSNSSIGASTNAAANLVLAGGTLQYTGVSGTTDRSFTLNAATTGGFDIPTAATTLTLTGTTASTTGALTKSGAGTLVIAGSNAYTGATTVNVGTLQIGNGGTTGALSSSSAISIASGATLAFNRTDNYGGNFSNTMSGAGGINILSGSLTLSTAKTYSGTTIVNAGTLTLGNNSAIQNSPLDTTGAGNVTLGSGITAPTLGGLIGSSDLSTVITSNYNLVTALTLNPVAGQTLTYSGNIINGAAGMTLTKSGSGTQILSGSNSYTGATTVSAGTLRLGSSTGVPAASALTVNGGFFDLNGINFTTNSLAAGNALGTITDNSAVSGTTTFTISGATAPALNTVLADGANGRTLAVVVLNNGNGSGNLSTNSTYSGGLTIGGTTNTRLNYTASGIGSVGNITSSQLGRGTLTLGQSASDKAQLVVSANVTILNPIVFNSSLGTDVTAPIRVTGTNIVLAGTLTAGLADITLGVGNNAGSATLQGQLTGSNGLWVKNSNSTNPLTLTLSNTTASLNSYLGNTTVDLYQTLVLGAANQIPSGAGYGNMSLSGSLNLGGYSTAVNNLTGAGTLEAGGGTPVFSVGGTNLSGTFSGVMKNTSGTLGLTKAGTGTFTLSGNNTYTGDTTINSGTLAIASTGRLGGGTYVGALSNNGTFIYSGTNAQTISGLISGSGAFTHNASNNSTLTLSGSISLSGASNSFSTTGSGIIDLAGNLSTAPGSLLTLALSSAGSGPIRLSGTSNNIQGEVLVTGAGGSGSALVWLFGTGNSLNGATKITVASGNTLRIWSASFGAGTAFDLNGTGNGGRGALSFYDGGTSTINGTVNLSGNSSILSRNAALTLAGNVTESGGARVLTLTADGGGSTTPVYTLSGSNSFSGGLNFNGGDFAGYSSKLTAGSATAFGTGPLALNSLTQATATATVDLNGQTITIGGLSGGNLANANSFIESGSGAATLTVNQATSSTFSGIIRNGSGSVALTKSGAGTLILAGSNTYTGTTTISSGTLQIGGGTTDGSLAASSDIVNNGVLAYNLVGNQSPANLISGAGALTKSGVGTLTINGTNTYTGATTINGGVLSVNNLADGGINSSIGASSNAASNLVLGGGTMQYTGVTGTTDHSFTLTASTTSVIDLPTASTTLTLTGTSAATNGALTKTGAGTLVLAGSNSHTGLTTISSGTLALSGAGSLSASGAVTVGNGGTFDLGGNSRSTTGFAYITDGGTLQNGTLTCNNTSVSTNNRWQGSITLGSGGAYVSNQQLLMSYGAYTTSFTIAAGSTGSMTFGGNNSNAENWIGGSGGTATLTINGGTVNFTNASNGTGNGYVNVAGSSDTAKGSIVVNGGNMNVGTVLKLGGNYTDSNSTNATSSLTITSGTVTVGGGDAAGNGSLNLNGSTSDTASTKTGTSTLTLNSGGVLQVKQINSGKYGTDTINFNGGTLRSGSSNTSFLASSSALSVKVGDGGATIDTNGYDVTIGAALLNNGSGGLTKSGSGALTLTANSTYIGATAVSTGKLIVSGSLSGATTLSVSTGAELKVNGLVNTASSMDLAGTLSGSGTVGAVTVQSGGVLSPGNSPGTLTTGTLALNAGGSYKLELNATTGTAGTNWDKIAATTLDLNALSSSNKFTLTLQTLTSGNVNGSLAGFDPAANYTWGGIITFGSLAGSFSANQFTIDTTGFVNTFDGSFSVVQNGSQLDLQYLAIPEPSTWAFMMGGLGMLISLQRMRSRRS